MDAEARGAYCTLDMPEMARLRARLAEVERALEMLGEEHAGLRRRVRQAVFRFGIASNPAWSPSDFDFALGRLEQSAICAEATKQQLAEVTAALTELVSVADSTAWYANTNAMDDAIDKGRAVLAASPQGS